MPEGLLPLFPSHARARNLAIRKVPELKHFQALDTVQRVQFFRFVFYLI